VTTKFLRIVNPKKPDEFLVLAKDDFDPALHTLFVPPATETPAEVAPETPAPLPAKPARVRKMKASSSTETV
jgi:hypothetical protein